MSTSFVALNNIFKDTSDFLVIGLTGRTGSGCSTAAHRLSQKDLNMPDVEQSHFHGNEKRKYRIIRDYINKKWNPFKWLQVRSIITRYILELNFSEFGKLVSECTDNDLQSVRDKLVSFKDEYEKAHHELKAFLALSEASREELEFKKLKAYELYFEYLPTFSNQLREALQRFSQSAYTALYQAAGDNIRASGKANIQQFDPNNIYSFANSINKVIKAARFKSKSEGKPCLIVIDAIRNPYEALYLRERYADFYLMSVNTDNKNRLEHLRSSHKFTDEQIKKLDDKEYPKKLKGDAKFTSQNIQKCIELSDIHVNNPRENRFGDSELVAQLGWYVSLMLHPGLVMPTATESCMQIAYSVKKNSGCISRQVGAVVSDPFNSVKAVGWNNSPQGQVPCLLRCAEHLLDGVDAVAYSDYEKNDTEFRTRIQDKFGAIISLAKQEGRTTAYCFKDVQNEIENERNQVHTRSLHAEENAFLQIAKYGGQMIRGGTLYTTASPCELCAKKAYQLGIAKIVFIDPYPGISTNHVLASGDEKPELILFRGAVGSAFHKLYQPMMPYKDELDMMFSIPKKEDNKQIKIKELENAISRYKEKIAALEEQLKSN
jgi:deoxycytidylate deaminase/dephospho-CoA kinase